MLLVFSYIPWKNKKAITKWTNTLKQFVRKLPTNCLSVFAYLVMSSYVFSGYGKRSVALNRLDRNVLNSRKILVVLCSFLWISWDILKKFLMDNVTFLHSDSDLFECCYFSGFSCYFLDKRANKFLWKIKWIAEKNLRRLLGIYSKI